MGKPRLPLLQRMRQEVGEELKRKSRNLPANRVVMGDLLTEAADRIEVLESRLEALTGGQQVVRAPISDQEQADAATAILAAQDGGGPLPMVEVEAPPAMCWRWQGRPGWCQEHGRRWLHDGSVLPEGYVE